MATFTYFQDPGHGWIKVPRKLLVELAILDDISGCSYQLGQNVYLEEDCDAGAFFEAYTKAYGEKPKIKSSHTNNQSKIRNYQSFNAKAKPVDKADLTSGMTVNIHGEEYVLIKKDGSSWSVIGSNNKMYRAKVNTMRYV